MADLTQAQWVAQLNQDEHAVIVDVRTDMEVAQGMIPDAIQIDIQNAASFMEKVKKLDASKTYYIYCRSGGRSAQACMIMNSLGFPNTYNLLGGMLEWKGEIV
ncbi:MAG TPA: rhodanese-like domain-containing protein [Flavobacteriaceae bacterium]|nr:rhodanese-like domain-containing protein [Flavobacteriaceae bacterium]MCB9214188.1 rhodanese-like domain-containing protein [Alteromonas sp.]HPF12581.1 rhodanese-like domain-containing protein [Flavobacteriaceae bacterium]HQU21179.1 rhodanese-like domain-containing protein [Flavobacteriaceae bacterium]HQU65379.1 rhodanese-like domain-containing protein [Flavobacteriaceae bacterium]